MKPDDTKISKWSRSALEDWDIQLEREMKRDRDRKVKKRLRAAVSAAMFGAVGALLILSHPDNGFNVGLGVAFMLFGAVVGLYELQLEE